MFGKHRWNVGLFGLPILLAATSACNRPLSASDLTLEHMDATRGVSRPSFTYMVDNAMLHDLSITDGHFIPHTNELNSTGTVKLERMTHLLNAYGGIVRYDTLSTDETLIQQRLDHARAYLALVGCNMDRVAVQVMMSGGRGMPADDAIKVKEKGTALDEASGATGGSIIGSR